MKNEYRIVDYRDLGLPSIEVHGNQFHYQDLYEIVGKNQYMTTFELRAGSESFGEYGQTVLGVIYYDRESLVVLEGSLIDGADVSKERVRIDSPDREITTNQKADLKYRGLIVSDIEQLTFLPYKDEIDNHVTGEKKVPGIIEIEVDYSSMDVDLLNQNYLVSKNNSGTNLVQYEKEQLVGITLAFNNGRIDSRILNHLGFNESDLKYNLNIWQQLYAVKERRKQLTEIDCKNYSEIKNILSLEKMIKAIKEITSTDLSNVESESVKEILKAIFKSINKFSPSILLHGKNQVYWDVDSYIHVALRHVKDFQLGFYKEKTPFPYKAHDLKLLIEKVLHRVEEEIEQYFSERSDNDFYRHGKMAIFFNGDHYHLRLSPGGRLIQFHIVGPYNKPIQPTANTSAD